MRPMWNPDARLPTRRTTNHLRMDSHHEREVTCRNQHGGKSTGRTEDFPTTASTATRSSGGEASISEGTTMLEDSSSCMSTVSFR